MIYQSMNVWFDLPEDQKLLDKFIEEHDINQWKETLLMTAVMYTKTINIGCSKGDDHAD